MTQKSQLSVVPVILLLAFMGGSALAEVVDFTVSETTGLRRFGYPVSASLELPAGAFANAGNARLLDAAGKSLPAQFTTMSHWQDGSVRGLEVDFALSLAPMETRSFRVDAGAGPQPDLPKGLSVVETPDEIIVASSAISHRIRRDGNPLLTSIRNGNQEFLAAGGITTTLAPGPVKVIKQGPFNVTLQLGEVRLEYVSSKSWVKITQRADAPADLAVDAHFELLPLPLLWDFGASSWLYGNLKKPGEAALLRQGPDDWQVFTGEGSEPSSLYATGKSCQGWGHLADRERVVAFGMGNYNTEGEPSFHLSAGGRLRAAARRKELTVYFHVVGQPVHVTAVTSPPSMLSPLSVKVSGAVRAGQAEAQDISERVLANLCSGPPADPLPPMHANRPSASEMAAKPKRHPYLFFDAESRQALRDRSKAEPFRGLADRLRAHAEECLKRTIPPTATDLTGIPNFLPDGSYNPEWLRRSADPNTYYTQSYAVQEVIPTLAFAYQLTGDARFGQAGKEWLLSFAARPKLAETGRETDFGAGYMAFGLALGYDWLWDLLSEPERRQVQQALTLLAKPIVAVAKDFLQKPDPNLHRALFGNNHRTRTHGLVSLAPLALLYEVPDAADWLDTEIQLHRDRLFPSAWAPNGEHLDAWGHFRASLEDPIAFVVALQRMGGEDLFHDPHLEARFRGIPRYFLYGLEGRFDARAYLSDWSYNTGWMNAWASCYAWPALASHLKDPTAQWIATRDKGVQQGNEIFGYLFYDPEVKAAAPVDPAGSVYWPYSGMVKMCSDWRPQGIMIPFRCGPEIGKDNGDQNGFRLRAGGDSLLPRLPIAQRKPGQPVEFDWDLMAWNFGSPSQNVVLLDPDEIGDAAILDRTGKIPIKGGIQFAQYPPMKGRDYDRQWLSGPEIIKRGELRVVHFDDALDYVCGEAHRAFAYIHPALWLRHILFVKGNQDGAPPYVLICDEVEADGKPRTFAWQLHPGAPYTLQGHKLSIQGEHAGLDVDLLWPVDATAVEKQTPAPLLNERTGFIQWRPGAPGTRCAYVTVLVPRTNEKSGLTPSFRVLEAKGGWAVEVSTGVGTDVALFRSERSKSVTAAGLSTRGTAALVRKSRQGSRVEYVLGTQK